MRDHEDPRRTRSTSPRATTLIALLAVLGCGDDGGGTGDGTTEASTGAASDTTTAVADTTAAETAADTTTTAASSSGIDPSSSTGDDDTTTGGEANELDDDAIARIHAAVNQSLGTGLATGCAVAIWRDGEVIYAEGFGTKDEAGNPVTNDTLFQIGSDTKKLTAMTLLQLVDAGELSLDQTVGELLPMLELVPSPGHFDGMTVHELLSHQSGLWDYTPWIEGADDGELSAVAYGRFATHEYAMMPPGIAWSYSNPNFSLAGLLVEELGGRSWPDVVIDDVALPLGLTQTYARRDDVVASATDIASGFGLIFPDGIDTFDLLEPLVPESIGWTTPEAQADHAFTRPAGLLWSTASDQALLGGFLIEGDPRVLSEASHAALVSGQVGLYPEVDPAELGYAYGVVASRGFGGSDGSFYDVPMLSHGGNTLSMTSTFMLLPDQNVAVSVLANGAYEDSTLIAAVALEEAAASRLPAPGEPYIPLQPPRDDLSVYAGSFTEPVLGDMTIGFDGNDVTIEIPTLTALGVTVAPVLLPIYRDMFLLTIDGSQLDVSFYDDTVPLEHGVNRRFVLRRTSAASQPAAPVRRELVEAWVRRVTSPSPLSLPLSRLR
jgi:CubicO group peptidase (beta-lactamase class C family)